MICVWRITWSCSIVQGRFAAGEGREERERQGREEMNNEDGTFFKN